MRRFAMLVLVLPALACSDLTFGGLFGPSAQALEEGEEAPPPPVPPSLHIDLSPATPDATDLARRMASVLVGVHTFTAEGTSFNVNTLKYVNCLDYNHDPENQELSQLSAPCVVYGANDVLLAVYAIYQDEAGEFQTTEGQLLTDEDGKASVLFDHTLTFHIPANESRDVEMYVDIADVEYIEPSEDDEVEAAFSERPFRMVLSSNADDGAQIEAVPTDGSPTLTQVRHVTPRAPTKSTPPASTAASALG